jgi:hypothetical protein
VVDEEVMEMRWLECVGVSKVASSRSTREAASQAGADDAAVIRCQDLRPANDLTEQRPRSQCIAT